MGRPSPEIGPGERDAPGPGPQISHDSPQRRGLAGPVPSDQADHLTLSDVERNLAQDLARLDVDVDALDRQHQRPLRPTTVFMTVSSARIAAGVPSASTRPSWRATIRSE